MSATRMGRINEEIQRTLAGLIRTVKDPLGQALLLPLGLQHEG